MSLDFTKPVQTRDGRKVRILCVDGITEVDGKKYPIVGFFEDGGSLFPQVWGIDGTYRYENSDRDDLINVPPPKKKVQVEVRLYRSDVTLSGLMAVVALPEEKFSDRTPLAFATIQMEYEEQP
jgi:hypothetical protein